MTQVTIETSKEAINLLFSYLEYLDGVIGAASDDVVAGFFENELNTDPLDDLFDTLREAL